REKPLYVVSNREPYMHVFSENEKSINIIVPASGVVTALEPVLRACNGTWIANGSGSADREVVDAHDRLRVPPDRPSYTMRRGWSRKRGLTRGWRFFGTFRGPIRRSLAFVRGSANLSMDCWAPTSWACRFNSTATIFWRPWIGYSRRSPNGIVSK